MPSFCAIIDCHSRSNRDRDDIKFFRVPAISTKKTKILITTKRQNAWIAAINRSGLNSSCYGTLRVCSKHFLSGK